MKCGLGGSMRLKALLPVVPTGYRKHKVIGEAGGGTTLKDTVVGGAFSKSTQRANSFISKQLN